MQSATKVSKRKKTSSLWAHFTIVDSSHATCNICLNKFCYKTTITNLKKHIRCRHPQVKLLQDNELKKEKESTIEVSNKPIINNDNFMNIQIEKCVNVATTPVVFDVASFAEWPNQETPSEVEPGEFLNNYKIDRSLLNLFTSDLQPISIIEGSGFRSFVNELNPTYQLPTKDKIINTLLPNTHRNYMNEVTEILNGAVKVCITFDNWTSNKNINFMTITAHFIDPSFKLNSVMLESLTITDNIVTDIDNVVQQWGISEKINSAITSNCRDIINAVRSIGWKQLDCFAYTFNTIVQDSIKPLSKLIDSVRTITRFINTLKSDKINNKILTELPNALILEETSQWNLVLEMLQKFLDMKHVITKVLQAMDHTLPVLTIDDWNTINQLVEVLKPFESVISSISGLAMASMIIVLIKGMLQVCDKLYVKNYNSLVKKVVCNLQSGLKVVFGDVETNETLAVCTLLDPRFKTFAFSNNNNADNAKQLLGDLILDRFEESETDSKLIQEDAELSIWNSLDSLVTVNRIKPTSRVDLEIQRYIEEDILNRKEDPIKWWQEHHCYYQYLGDIAREWFCIMATSVPAEHIFSNSNSVLNERRMRIPTKLNKSILFMHSNSHLMTDCN